MASLRLFVLLFVAIAAVHASMPPPRQSGTFPCSYFDVIPANPNLNTDYFYVFENSDGSPNRNYGFGANEFYTNSLSSLMSEAVNPGVYFLINATGSYWNMNTHSLWVNIDIYSSSARTLKIGNGTLTSSNFMAMNATDPHNGQPVVFVGGDVMLEYYIPSSYSQMPAPGFHTTVWQSSTVNVTYTQSNSMWTSEPTFTNRLFFPADAPTFYAPLFNSSTSQSDWYGHPLTAYTATYNAVVILWGSSGYSYSQGAYTAPTVGMDLAFALTCNSNPPVIHNVPTPTCGSHGVNCAACIPAELSGQCSDGTVLSAHTSQMCMTFAVEETRPCTPGATVLNV